MMVEASTFFEVGISLLYQAGKLLLFMGQFR